MIMSAMSHTLTKVLVILTIIHKSSQELNLVAAWWFTSTNGGTDLSTYAENDVNINPLTYRIGPNGETDGAVEFRDVDIDGFLGGGRFDVVSITDKLVFSASMTFFCHVYIPAGSNKDRVLFAYKGSSLPALVVDLDTGSVQVENSGIDPSNGNSYIDLTDLLQTKLDQWLQLAVVYDTTYGVKIYESGILLSQTPYNVDLSSLQIGTPLTFGGKDEFTQTMTGGALACAQFYNTALTQAEVQALTCDVASSGPATSAPGTDDRSSQGTTPGNESDLLEIQDVVRDGDDIVVRGTGFQGASVTIQLNGSVCTDADITDTEIRCILSDNMIQKFERQTVIVEVVDADGSIIHTSDVPYVTTDPIDTQTIIIIVASIAGGLIVIVIIIVIVAVRNKRRKRQKERTQQNNVYLELEQ